LKIQNVRKYLKNFFSEVEKSLSAKIKPFPAICKHFFQDTIQGIHYFKLLLMHMKSNFSLTPLLPEMLSKIPGFQLP